MSGSVSGRAQTGAPQGFAREGDPRTVRGGRPAGQPIVLGRLPGHDRRPPHRVGADPAPAGDPGLRRRGAVRHRHHRPRLDRGDRQRRRQPRRAEVLEGDEPADQPRRRGRRRLDGRVGEGPARRRPRAVGVSGADQALLRRPRRARRRPPVLRRHRGEDPRHRRLRGRDHRDRPRPAGRRPQGDRHDPHQLHRGRRQPRVGRRPGQAQGDGSGDDAAQRCARRPGQGAAQVERQRGASSTTCSPCCRR